MGAANRNPVATFEANIAGTWAVLEAVRRSPKVAQVVTASSDKAYGSQPVLPYDESMPMLALNPYDVRRRRAPTCSATPTTPPAARRVRHPVRQLLRPATATGPASSPSAMGSIVGASGR